MDIKTLDINQTVSAKAAIGLIRGFILSLDESLRIQSKELSQTLERLDGSESIMLKKIDSAFTAFLSVAMAPLKQADQSQRALFVKDLEHHFQSQRASASGQSLLEDILHPLLTGVRPKNIWVPGCGEAYEAAWINAKFPTVDSNYLDIDAAALAKAERRIDALNNKKAKVWSIDLTKPELLPPVKPDLILFFNPFVIEYADYQHLVMTLSDKKTTESKADRYLSSLSMSSQAQTIYNNIINHMNEKRFISVTMDLAEAHVIHNFFTIKKIPVTCYRNPYAVKNLASLILSKRSPKTEPKIYHYVLDAHAT